MDRWKSRGGKSQRGEEKQWEEQWGERVRRKKRQVREKVGKSQFTQFFQWFVAPEGQKVGSLKRRAQNLFEDWLQPLMIADVHPKSSADLVKVLVLFSPGRERNGDPGFWLIQNPMISDGLVDSSVSQSARMYDDVWWLEIFCHCSALVHLQSSGSGLSAGRSVLSVHLGFPPPGNSESSTTRRRLTMMPKKNCVIFFELPWFFEFGLFGLLFGMLKPDQLHCLTWAVENETANVLGHLTGCCSYKCWPDELSRYPWIGFIWCFLQWNGHTLVLLTFRTFVLMSHSFTELRGFSDASTCNQRGHNKPHGRHVSTNLQDLHMGFIMENAREIPHWFGINQYGEFHKWGYPKMDGL